MFHEQFEQQNVANSIENERFELKNAANTVETAASSSKMLQIISNNSMEHERFQLQNVAKTVEVAASSSKMLQIERKTGRKADLKKNLKTEKTNPKTILDPCKMGKPQDLFEDAYYDILLWLAIRCCTIGLTT